MNRAQLYISTIARDAAEAAQRYGMGLEIAEYCTAYNMDERFPETDEIVRHKLDSVRRRMLHAPFNELFPCAIDPKARALACSRYRQAVGLAHRYGAEKVVIHGGYHPRIYYPSWYREQSRLFWKAFLKTDPGVELVLENVLEEEPELLMEIVKAVKHPGLRLCLDVGHANAYSKVPVLAWLHAFAPYLSHFHLHNNRGDCDAHQGLADGTISMADFLREAERLCPDATFTLEVTEAESSARWLAENKF